LFLLTFSKKNRLIHSEHAKLFVNTLICHYRTDTIARRVTCVHVIYRKHFPLYSLFRLFGVVRSDFVSNHDTNTKTFPWHHTCCIF